MTVRISDAQWGESCASSRDIAPKCAASRSARTANDLLREVQTKQCVFGMPSPPRRFSHSKDRLDLTRNLTFSPDGKYLASGCLDKMVRTLLRARTVSEPRGDPEETRHMSRIRHEHAPLLAKRSMRRATDKLIHKNVSRVAMASNSMPLRQVARRAVGRPGNGRPLRGQRPGFMAARRLHDNLGRAWPPGDYAGGSDPLAALFAGWSESIWGPGVLGNAMHAPGRSQQLGTRPGLFPGWKSLGDRRRPCCVEGRM